MLDHFPCRGMRPMSFLFTWLNFPLKRSVVLALGINLILPLAQVYAAEKLIGSACSGDANFVDWDTVGQCSSNTVQRVSPFLATGLAINMGSTAPASTADISGNMTVGATYAGINAAPANGLLVQGLVAIGTSSATSGASLDLGTKTDSLLLPVGTTGQQPTSPVAGMVRYNSTTKKLEYFNGLTWTAAKPTGAPASSGYIVMTKETFSGCMNVAISSIFGNGTVVSIQTVYPHGLSTGALVTTYGIVPSGYNATNVSITVTGSNTFTFPSTTSGTVTTIGAFCSGSGGLAVANANCLYDLKTYSTNWFGYKQANAAGLLNSTHVKAFLCDGSTCNNLDATNPGTVYYFSSNLDSSSGGASFTASTDGYGPNDSIVWARADHFSGLAGNYYTGRGTTSNTLWSGTSSFNTCSGWTSLSSNGDSGTNNYSTSNRWNISSQACTTAFPIICLVNP